jgi:hypothetical protein
VFVLAISAHLWFHKKNGTILSMASEKYNYVAPWQTVFKNVPTLNISLQYFSTFLAT